MATVALESYKSPRESYLGYNAIFPAPYLPGKIFPRDFFLMNCRPSLTQYILLMSIVPANPGVLPRRVATSLFPALADSLEDWQHILASNITLKTKGMADRECRTWCRLAQIIGNHDDTFENFTTMSPEDPGEPYLLGCLQSGSVPTNWICDACLSAKEPPRSVLTAGDKLAVEVDEQQLGKFPVWSGRTHDYPNGGRIPSSDKFLDLGGIGECKVRTNWRANRRTSDAKFGQRGHHDQRSDQSSDIVQPLAVTLSKQNFNLE
ncbi:hypothetical protein B0H11DRAFT_2195285 [Mycena galericulata]|nr:hypothetical protein B0H11DRAFT_2195285 [Mycena galericulata]